MDDDNAGFDLGKLITIENIVQVLIFTSLMSFAYASMSKDIESNQTHVDQIAKKQEAQSEMITSIKVDVAQIRANQISAGEDRARQQRSIEMIIDILEGRR